MTTKICKISLNTKVIAQEINIIVMDQTFLIPIGVINGKLELTLPTDYECPIDYLMRI